MKLREEEKQALLQAGYPESDFKQIEEALGKTKYTLCRYDSKEEKRIFAKEARELLTPMNFSTGIGRSAFHWSSVRDIDDKTYIYFDSSRLFQ